MNTLESSRKKLDAAAGGDGVVNFHNNTNEAKHQKHKSKTAAQAILDRAQAASRGLNEDEQKEYDTHLSVITQAGSFIDGKEKGSFLSSDPSAFRMPGLPGEEPQHRTTPGNRSRVVIRPTNQDEENQLAALTAVVSGDQRYLASANLLPSSDGGYVIPSFVADPIEQNWAQDSPVVQVARLFPTDTGADVTFPVISDSEVAEQLDALSDTGDDTPPTALTGPTLHAYKTSSKPVQFARELITDQAAGIDLVGDLVSALLGRIIRFENQRFTTGTGSGQQQGFMQGATHFEGSGTVTLDEMLDLAYSVPARFRSRGVYMMSDATIKFLRKFKTGLSGDKRDIWSDGDVRLGQPATLHGYPVFANPAMSDVSGSGAYTSGSVAFGDFSKFIIRQAEQNAAFIRRYQINHLDAGAVILFRRTDSKLIVPEAISKLVAFGS